MMSSEYHRITAYERHTLAGKPLDWKNQPDVFKVYDNGPAYALPENGLDFSVDLWSLHKTPFGANRHLDFSALAILLDLTNALTAGTRHVGKDFYYRSVASAGALYPNELYTGVYDVSGVQPGIYHYGVGQRILTCLREGDFGADVRNLVPVSSPEIAATFFITGIFFRSAWKYGERAYRYVLLDAGHLLENLLLALRCCRFEFVMRLDFEDEKTNALLGVDGRHEACLCGVHVVKGARDISLKPFENKAVSVHGAPEAVARKVSPIGIEYQEIIGIHKAGRRIHSPPIQSADPDVSIGLNPKTWMKLPEKVHLPETILYPTAVFSRRSKRNFVDRSVSIDVFSGLIDLLVSGYREFHSQPNSIAAPIGVGVGAKRVDGLDDGLYLCNLHDGSIGLIKPGDFSAPLARICLDQLWLKQAALHFLFMANFKAIDETAGPRGYRHALMTAGSLGQLLYIGATALGLGCCGIGALFDFEAQHLLGLNTDSYLFYLVGIGQVKNQ
jgi:SagB-type dehydrogenase family enzyme